MLFFRSDHRISRRHVGPAPISKFLSLILRHQPETIGLTLDDQGWVQIDELIRFANAHGQALSRETIERIVRESEWRDVIGQIPGTEQMPPHFKLTPRHTGVAACA